MIDDSHSSPTYGFLRPALSLAGGIVAVALLLLPIAWDRVGTSGPIGLAAAAGICLAGVWIVEGIAIVLHKSVSPLGLMLLSMGVRMALPLGICLVLATQGARGRQHTAFICYLLTFYLAMLALETWLSVRRVPVNSSRANHNAH